MEHKGGHWLVLEKCILRTAVCNRMQRGTSQAEATSNSENFKLLALAIIKLCLSEGISQSGSQSEEHSFK